MREEVLKKKRRERRVKRIRVRVLGISRTSNRLRLSIFRSNKYLYAQIVDDRKGKTIVSVHEKELQKTNEATKKEKAKVLGSLLAKKAEKKGVKKLVFDKGAYKYHGRIQAFAEGAREGGLEF